MIFIVCLIHVPLTCLFKAIIYLNSVPKCINPFPPVFMCNYVTKYHLHICCVIRMNWVKGQLSIRWTIKAYLWLLMQTVIENTHYLDQLQMAMCRLKTEITWQWSQIWVTSDHSWLTTQLPGLLLVSVTTCSCVSLSLSNLLFSTQQRPLHCSGYLNEMKGNVHT